MMSVLRAPDAQLRGAVQTAKNPGSRKSGVSPSADDASGRQQAIMSDQE
jgi:hypothetical protein